MACSPNTTPTRCNVNTPQFCNTFGAWQNVPQGACPAAAPTCNAGSCQCPSPNTSCSGTVCTNTATDARNCGTCGHDCLGGQCSAGQCQPVRLATTPLSSNPGQAPFAITVGPSAVYWINLGYSDYQDATVSSVGLDGGTVTSLDSGYLGYSIVLNPANNTLYYPGVQQLRSISASGGTPSIVQSGSECNPVGVHSLAIENGVIWCTSQTNAWVARPGTGGTISATKPSAIALNSQTAYFIDGDTIFQTPFSATGSSKTVFYTSTNAALFDIAATESAVYWTNSSGNPGVWKAGVSGDNPSLIAGSSVPGAVAVDSSGVYWVTNSKGASGSVYRTGLSGGAIKALATNQGGPTGIALDANAVYWTNFATGEIMKVAK